MRSTLVMLCHFPPPLTGNSNVSQHMRNKFVANGNLNVKSHPFSPHFSGPNRVVFLFARTFVVLGSLLSILANRLRERQTVYTTMDSGNGIVFNILSGLVFRLTADNILVHHHSYSYITERSRLAEIAFRVYGRNAIHIVLGSQMQLDLKVGYPTIRNALVLNNAFVVEKPESIELTPNRPLTLGHLSNLCEEKGIDEVIDTARILLRGFPDLKLIVAGPADSYAHKAIEVAKLELGETFEYRGPIYGKDKEQFYRDCDVFLFPTKYRVEAAPTVLIEAMSYGVVPISYERGMIREILYGLDTSISQRENFSHFAADLIQSWLNRDQLGMVRQVSLSQYDTFLSASAKQIEKVIDIVSDG